MATLIANILLIRADRLAQLKQPLIFNLFLFSVQSIVVLVDGFLFRYVQGTTFFIFVNKEKAVDIYKWGYYLDFLVLEFDMRGGLEGNTMIGINAIALTFMIITWVLLRRLSVIKSAESRETI